MRIKEIEKYIVYLRVVHGKASVNVILEGLAASVFIYPEVSNSGGERIVHYGIILVSAKP